MFSRDLQGLTLASEVANELFPHIESSIRGHDLSFLATARALIAPRMKDGEGLQITVKTVTSDLRSYSDEDVVLKLSDGMGSNTLLLCGINGSEAVSNHSYDTIERSFLRYVQGFAEFEALGAFMKSKRLFAHCYINAETRSTVIYVKGLNTRIYHLMQAFLTKLCPWYFTEETPVTEEEKALLRTLTLNTSAEYEELIEKFAQKYDFRSIQVKKILKGFETASKRQLLDAENSLFSRIEAEIQSNIRSYRQLIEKRSESLIRIAGLQNQINVLDEHDEVMEFFLHNQHLDPVGVSGSALEFIVRGTLNNFDPEMYESLARNETGYLYTSYAVSCSVFNPPAVRKELMDAIFSDEATLKVRMCSYYEIDVKGTVSVQSGYLFSNEYKDYIPNPHLHYHACLGDHKRFIEESLRDGDIVGAVAQCVSSTGSLNIGESVTVNKFLQTLFSSSCTNVIELPDGTCCTPTKALEWIRAHKNKEDA